MKARFKVGDVVEYTELGEYRLDIVIEIDEEKEYYKSICVCDLDRYGKEIKYEGIEKNKVYFDSDMENYGKVIGHVDNLDLAKVLYLK